ncbi:MAG: hypothetical protein JWN09_2081 [Microbacteriaceae bacterium]|nr:hypothetical protein [Microbacteriaceae bacterium]
MFSVSVFQYRSDYAPRQLQIEVKNTSAVDATVTRASFSSDWFASPVSTRSTPAQVLGKSTTDLPVVLAAASCGPKDANPVVRLAYRMADGSSGTVTARPRIPFSSLAMVHAQDCSRAAFERVATITPASALRFDNAGGKPVALLDVTVTPTGAPGRVTLHTTSDTTLLAQREGRLRSFELSFDASTAPTTITLDYVPSRCEQHVVAEDKVGTVIPIRVDAGTFRDALIPMPVSPAVKNQLLDWVGTYCGW